MSEAKNRYCNWCRKWDWQSRGTRISRNEYQVTLAGRREDALLETISLAEAFKTNASAVPTDVADPNAVRALFDGVEKNTVELTFFSTTLA